MRKLLTAAAAALGLAFTTPAAVEAAGHGWKPAGPIKMLIAFRAGGGADTQARLIAEELEARHGWKVIPEQVTGKGGANMAVALKDMPNDGTAIGMVVTETFAYNMIAAKRQAYTQADFTPLTTTAGFQMGVVALTSKGWASWDDVIVAAKGGQDIRFGVMSPKLGDLAYMLGKEAGVEFNIVSVKGGKGVMNGLNAGDLDVGWGAGIQGKAVKAGDMVNLLSGISKPLTLTPDAPLLKDVGVPFNADGYFMFTAPAGLPNDAREAITNAIAEIVNDPATKANGMINKAFGGPVVIAGADLEQALAADAAAAKDLLKAASE